MGTTDRGDRLVENSTHFVLDINTELSQVLEDGTYKYLYGNERLAQLSPVISRFFLGDVLNSVRQLCNENGGISSIKNFDPFGNTLSSGRRFCFLYIWIYR
jgi:hypothetical protein